jgi:hypothetical protein
MPKHQNLILHPTMVQQDSLLTIQNIEGAFQNNNYIIKNETGSIIRKGNISNSFFGFQLRVVGFKTGLYQFIMGDQQENFQVV